MQINIYAFLQGKATNVTLRHAFLFRHAFVYFSPAKLKMQQHVMPFHHVEYTVYMAMYSCVFFLKLFVLLFVIVVFVDVLF